MDWSVQHVARLAGTTSRTLRHYDERGLVPPSRIGANGYRYYDERAIVRLQRVLLLRDLGLGLSEIARTLAGETDEIQALSRHLVQLHQERGRLERQAAAVELTIARLSRGELVMPEEALDGFDHTQYKDEVVERWGADAYRCSDEWWRGMSEAERREWKGASTRLIADWRAAAEAPGADPTSPAAGALARRHVEWLAAIPGTPHGEGRRDYLLSLADMYVQDARFAKTYGGVDRAHFVRDALIAHLRD